VSFSKRLRSALEFSSWSKIEVQAMGSACCPSHLGSSLVVFAVRSKSLASRP
jgi:hypothetical protein